MTLNAKVTITATDNTRVFQHLINEGGGWFLYIFEKRIVKVSPVSWLDVSELELGPRPVIILPQDEEVQRRLLGASGVLTKG